jgi:DNA-binding transcriptional regulator YiaG
MAMPTATITRRSKAYSKTRERKLASSRRAHASADVGGLPMMRRRYGMSQALLARLLDVSLRTVSAAESAPALPSPLRRSITQVNRLCAALAESMQGPFVGPWLDQPSKLLAGLKPVEAIERGQLDLVWQVVEGLRSGSLL